jgi:hypothetical protein
VPKTQRLAVVKQKPPKPIKTFESSLPLVNPETLFSRGVWAETVNFVADYLQTALGVKKIQTDLTITFRDLYFAKDYEKFDFAEAEKNFSNIGFEPKGSMRENNDRDDEFGLTLPIEQSFFHLKEFRGDICFSVGNCISVDDPHVKHGLFPHSPMVWKTDVTAFMNFVEAIEQTLTGRGQPVLCRAHMTVKMQRCEINIACHYNPIFRESYARIWKRLSYLQRVRAPRFTISFF